MSKAEKILQRFLSKPKDFSYSELKRLLEVYGYEEIKKGKTGGSRVAFINFKTKHIIRLHKPHPKPELKSYQVDYIVTELKKMEVIK